MGKKVFFRELSCGGQTPDVVAFGGEISTSSELEEVDSIHEADYIVLVCCAFSSTTISEGLELIAEAKQLKQKDAKIIVGGCLPKVKMPQIQEMEGIILLKEDWYSELSDLMNINMKFSNISYIKRTAGLIKISMGCENRCTFCKVHYMERPYLSYDMRIILDDANRMLERGVSTITLTAQNLALYGIDFGEKALHELIAKITATELNSLRLLALAPQDVYNYPELITEIGKNKKVEMIELPVETGSDQLLKRMGRNHTIQQYEEVINAIREKNPHIAINTHLMSGFPGEEFVDVAATVDFIIKNQIYINSVSDFINGEVPAKNMEQLSVEDAQAHYHFLESFAYMHNKELTHK